MRANAGGAHNKVVIVQEQRLASSARASFARSLLQLFRPANVLTSPPNTLAGLAISGSSDYRLLAYLLPASALLYAGGIVLNDYFDRHLDAIERPERPIPRGAVSAGTAAALGFTCLSAGVLLAIPAGGVCGLLALAVAIAVLSYDMAAKRHPFIGPVNMGLCRGLNFLLGVACVPSALAHWWPLGLLPVVYIAAVTALSRGEVRGGKRPVALASFAMLVIVIVALLAVIIDRGTFTLAAVAILCVLGARVLPAYWQAIGDSSAPVIRRAVKTGVLSLVLLDATLAMLFAGPWFALGTITFGACAYALARAFAVT